jgi:hypothetical protein
MSTRKHATAIQGLSRRSRRLYRKLSKRLVNGLLRSVLPFQRRGSLSTSGFILPTTVLLILIVVLTVGALTFRAFTRNTQVIGQAEQKVIYNAATPAIDRARSKLEFMFDGQKDTRLPGGVPSQSVLESMLLNSGVDRDGAPYQRLTFKDAKTNATVDPYTLPDEQRLDLNGDGRTDNAWWFRTDTNSDGRVDERDSTIVYSIVLNTPRATTQGNKTTTIGTQLLQMDDRDKAKDRYVRQAPLSIDNALGCQSKSPTARAAGPDGWFEDSRTTAVLRKNFQVDAIVIPGNANGTKVALEFTQDRQLNRGNKWGAWFRNDLEIYPGAEFNWNGAMHTEGSFIVGRDKFTAYLISSTSSCLFSPDSSEITVTKMTPDASNPRRDYFGLVTSGLTVEGSRDDKRDKANFHLHTSTNPGTGNNSTELNSKTSSSKEGNPNRISLDPERVLLDPQNGYTNRQQQNNESNINPDTKELPDFAKDNKGNKLPRRIYNNPQPMPYVDDLYRADDRLGPKRVYDKSEVTQKALENRKIGDDITDLVQLTRTNPEAADAEAANVGLDGYWERRARSVGMRILVGERLELGNLFTWYGPQDKDGNGLVVPPATGVVDQPQYEHEGDPLYPPNIAPYPANKLSHIDLQRRTLRDNLSAVQSTAVYHSALANNSEERDYPVACLATTAHPGTLTTLRQALTFRPFEFWGTDDNINGSLLSNFFTGVGTNGWEYEPPEGNFSNFKATIANPQSPLRRALQNLANFAGDHQNGLSGAYPPTQEQSGTIIHPYPALSMWGNFSNLKRALADLDSKGYDTLSVADKTYLQTASCTLGMLASNIDQIQKFDPSNPKNDKTVVSNSQQRMMARLGRDLWTLMNGTNTSTDPEVLPREQLATYDYKNPGTYSIALYDVRDYDKVPPEVFIAALRQFLLGQQGMNPDSRDFIEEMRLAELIMLHYQIRRDRTFGFKPSPAFGYYDFQGPGGVGTPFIRRISVACDPDQFAFSGNDLRLLSDGYSATELGTTSTDKQNVPVDPEQNPNLPRIPTLTNSKRSLGQYRVALSRLCGTLDYTLVPPGGNVSTGLPNSLQVSDNRLAGMAVIPVILPKFPALYYLFPEVDHRLRGEISTVAGNSYDHRQPDSNNPYLLLSRSPISNKEGDVSTLQQLQTQSNSATVTLVREPYVTDTYIGTINAEFLRISNTAVQGRSGYTSPSNNIQRPSPSEPLPAVSGVEGQPSRRPRNQVFPIADYQVSQLALQPRNPNNLSSLSLPYLDPPTPYSATATDKQRANFSTNLVLVPNGDNLKPIAVPFLDRAIFDGRQLMLARTLDIDLGMLRSTRVAGKQDIWLPLSGIVYAFREDAVREDAIARPVGTEMNLQTPGRETDPPKRKINSAGNIENDPTGISTKSIDSFPDPDRRIHGFRLRNGIQIMRNRGFEGTVMDAIQNVRGLSFFTDQPLYIQGDFNLHQNGADDTIGTLLEEFEERLPEDKMYNSGQFYGSRKTADTNFASPESSTSADRWRPSEILADSITILSNNFCDGTIADTFVQMATIDWTKAYPVPDFQIYNEFNKPENSRNYYHQLTRGLFDPGCTTANVTSFHNQNRPAGDKNRQIPAKQDKTANGWDWVRENSRYDTIAPHRNMSGSAYSTGYWVDFAAPVKISRTGHPVIVRPRDDTRDSVPPARHLRVLPPVSYIREFSTTPYYNYGEGSVSGVSFSGLRTMVSAVRTRINSIIVSGINPSRSKQGYGGLHNFPRFVENWKDQPLNFRGSLMQLSFTNYATAPFELENLEPGATAPSPDAENIQYYNAPLRLWGYDVGLQFSPAGPAAARFVTAGKNRSEFYVEPPADDPYISNLCKAAKQTVPGLKTNCPERN